ncbi:MAG: S-layer homology domain-containing protein [Oscillospiraceae bacterium]|nr:S-layer homology domain-containing protein [Oscillospiraceae bacterium]
MKVCIQSDYKSIPYPSATLPGATLASGGCGVCSAVMIAENLAGVSFPAEQAAVFAMESGARVIGGTDMNVLGAAVAEKFGLEFSVTDDPAALISHLCAGGMAVANVSGDRPGRQGIFSNSGHFVTVAAARENTLTVLDPGYYEGKFDLPGRQGKVTVLRRGVVECSAADLHADCAGRSPRYWLFSVVRDNIAHPWEQEGVNWAVELGIIRGDDRGDLQLHTGVTKAQLAVMLKRFYDAVK